VTNVVKRRQQTSRPEAKVEAIEPRNPERNGKADIVVCIEGNIAVVVKGKTSVASPGSWSLAC